MNSTVFVVVPAFNERQAILSTLQPLINLGYSVVVVDDGSTDSTWNLLSHFPIYLLRHPVNLGQGAALQTGMTFALENGAEIIVHFDADGQHRVEDVGTLIEPLRKGEADIVLGSRFLRESDRLAVPPLKRVLLRAALIVNGFATGLWLSDAHNGFRAMTADAARKIRLHENRFAHATEILNQLARAKLRYVEMPTSISYSDYSKAKGQSMGNAINIVIDLFLRRLFK